jgi:peptidoglycan hydrolase-like protein with peptidoglycan-binding domain
MWGSWDGRWHDYNGCSRLKSHSYDNACHRTHIHISLSWNGAMGRTSFWTKKVSPTDFGPCRARDLNWAYRYVRTNYRGCAQYRLVPAPKHASATKKALVEYSGAPVRHGWGGPAVTAVQRGLHVAASGYYGASTRTAVRRFQGAHHLNVTGAMNPKTWRALLKAVR